jgi:GNAT superfamily N-acetyltransferase
MDNLTFRKATLNDSELAYQVKKAAFKDYVEKVWGWNEAEQRQLHERRFNFQDVRIIQLGMVPIGIMAVVLCPDCLRLNQLCLLPEYQGKGIGAECMIRIIEKAQRLTLPVRLRVLKVNRRALTFYQRLGFTRTGETDVHILMEKA